MFRHSAYLFLSSLTRPLRAVSGQSLQGPLFGLDLQNQRADNTTMPAHALQANSSERQRSARPARWQGLYFLHFGSDPCSC